MGGMAGSNLIVWKNFALQVIRGSGIPVPRRKPVEGKISPVKGGYLQ